MRWAAEDAQQSQHYQDIARMEAELASMRAAAAATDDARRQVRMLTYADVC
jgi:hypothetical protein